MKVEWHLSKEKKEQLEEIRSPKKKRQKKISTTNFKTKAKKQENLSFKDLEELMGTKKQVLHRKRGGAWG